jgi:hypothetical protein
MKEDKMPEQEKPENETKQPSGEQCTQGRPTETGAVLTAGTNISGAAGRPPTQPVSIEGEVDVAIKNQVRMAVENAPNPKLVNDVAASWNAVILSCTTGMRFDRYERFIERVFCDDEPRPQAGRLDPPPTERTLRRLARGDDNGDIFRAFSNLYAYDLLKVATEAYLALQCIPFEYDADPPKNLPDFEGTVLNRENTQDDLRKALNTLLDKNRLLPYIDRVAGAYLSLAEDTRVSFCEAAPLSKFTPCCIELIWSYWHEEGMLVQAINAISLRFQNKRTGTGRDPLAHLELEPLRPLNNILWGYIQDEHHRLTVARRAYEYQHEYGLTLYGKAVPALNPADVRSKFIEAFHNLLHTASVYYRDLSNRFVVPDSFPLLNAIKEVHLILAEGAHNQFGDLPWTARVEMMIQKWMLSRPEIEKFLGGRAMVPYPERWMGVVDQMKTLQGWTDVSTRHFLDLAELGERLLLSIRWENWSETTTTLSIENWALIWRDAIQGYIHAYRAVTGVDLAASSNTVRLSADSYTQPSTLLRNRLAAQRRT